MQPRIVDIARIAKVSPAAVSLALNNRGGISAALRRKIVSVAAELGYRRIPPANPRQAGENITIRLLKIAKHGHIIN